MRRVQFLRTLVLACTVGWPRQSWALTGVVAKRFDVGEKDSLLENFGWVCVQFARTSDEAYGTNWVLVTDDGPKVSKVLPRGSTTGARLAPATRHTIYFERRSGNSSSNSLPPPITDVDIVADKVTTYYIKYV